DERSFSVFTTRPDTLFGVTYMVLAPEHPLVGKITTPECRAEVEKYIELTSTRNEIERTSLEREKTGVFTGAYAVNPVNSERVPVWIADYVLISYGTGIVMAVPGHDERDFEFARKFGLPVREVIAPPGSAGGDKDLEEAYIEPGTMVNSGRFDGMPSPEGGRAVVVELKGKGLADFKVNYKIRDWLISRQRYWGVPIPIVYCDKCGEVPVPEDRLPVTLPYEVDFEKAHSGESPLATNSEFLHTSCPACGTPARREIDTMDTFVDSSWYFLRYLTPGLEEAPFDRCLTDAWLPVEHYVGGVDHATMHLIYARFVNIVLYDLGFIGFPEPFKRLSHQGTITCQGAKMSKSRGNVINPESYLERYGSDTFRCYLMFMGSYELGGDWDDSGIHGMNRFTNRLWRLVWHNAPILKGVIRGTTVANNLDKLGKEEQQIARVMHNSIKGATEDLERMHFNTALSRIMELVNELIPYAGEEASGGDIEKRLNLPFLAEAVDNLVLLIAPFAPHMGEELWNRALCHEEHGQEKSVFCCKWPQYDEEILKRDVVTVVIQVNGKLRSQLEVPRDLPQEELKTLAMEDGRAAKFISGKEVRKVIHIPNKLVNIVAV
ncbi:MAG: class I tRNA ligase family protein, partial [Gemmatimonadota bacterium]|nr:class I tRNA ligase family protein [Gemmatimonadota bacterium]